MKKLCPNCRTEMIERSNIHVCPRNEIGDCSYDALSLTHEMPAYQLNDVNACSGMHSYVSQDSK
jgi:protein PhnA